MGVKILFRLITWAIFIMGFISTQNQSFANIYNNSDYEIDTSFWQKITPTRSTPQKQQKNRIDANKGGQASLGKQSSSTGELFNPFLTSLTVAISPDTIQYGQVVPGEPLLRTLNISLTQSPYLTSTVHIYQDSVLTFGESIIPDTSCDNGSCTTYVGSVWNSPLTFGLGYRCERSKQPICDHVFTDTDVYKKIATGRTAAAPLLLATGSQDIRADLTFKLNTTGTQPTGQYINTITILSLPSL